MHKPAPTDHPIHEILQNRWSPRAFSDALPETEILLSLFEAARWTPSSMNAQPWAFILARRDDPAAYQRMFSLLTENNQRWAAGAPLLVLAVMNSLRPNGKPHRWAPYDLGQAVAHLTFQAGALGLAVHQMGGFDAARAAEVYQLPTGYEAMAVLAIGAAGDPAALPDDLRQRELSPRERKPLPEVVFDGEWGRPLIER
ncbi:MAG: nitroreductase family protein [Anaerolineae bacterium]|nr:nitroreductase family protein [Anaerolineae bacterium]